MRLKDFALDIEAIESGSWREAPGMKGVRIKIRGEGNADWKRVTASEIGAAIAASKTGELSDEASEAITTKVLHETCLQDWSGLTEDDGKTAIPYSPEFALKLLTDPAYKRFRTSVYLAARTLANETVAEREKSAKN